MRMEETKMEIHKHPSEEGATYVIIKHPEWISMNGRRHLKLGLAEVTYAPSGNVAKDVIFPCRCPACGGRLDISYSGTLDQVYQLDENGMQGGLVSKDEDIIWDNVLILCGGCQFAFEIESLGKDFQNKLYKNGADLS
jgi:hypothetical protein